jgi:hypothetical protein
MRGQPKRILLIFAKITLISHILSILSYAALDQCLNRQFYMIGQFGPEID